MHQRAPRWYVLWNLCYVWIHVWCLIGPSFWCQEMEPLYPPQEPRSDDQSRMAAREAEIRLRSPHRRTHEVDVTKLNTGAWLNSPQRRTPPAQVSLVYGHVHSMGCSDLSVTLWISKLYLYLTLKVKAPGRIHHRHMLLSPQQCLETVHLQYSTRSYEQNKLVKKQ
jgi:hypothetical protein